MPSSDARADVDRHDGRDRGAELEPGGPHDPEHRGERRRQRHDPVDPGPDPVLELAGQREAARDEGETQGRDGQRQAVVQLGHRHERDVVARGRRGLERRGERRGQDQQELDEGEQARAEEEDGHPRGRVRMAGEERGREQDRSDRGEDLEAIERVIAQRGHLAEPALTMNQTRSARASRMKTHASG